MSDQEAQERGGADRARRGGEHAGADEMSSRRLDFWISLERKLSAASSGG